MDTTKPTKEDKQRLKEQAIELRLEGYTHKEISSLLDGKLSIDQLKRLLRGIKPKPLQNTIKEAFCNEWYGREDSDTWPVWIDDIVTGVARLDWYGDKDNQIPLSTTKIITCYLWLEEFTIEGIMSLLECSKWVARIYLNACRTAYPFFTRSLDNEAVLRMKYPRHSIVSEEHGIDEEYHLSELQWVLYGRRK